MGNYLAKKNSLSQLETSYRTQKFGRPIQRLELKNNALLAGLVRRLFHSPNQLWANTFIQKYKNKRTIGTSSNTWHNILLGWEKCQHGIQWKVGTNSKINF